MKLLEIKNLSIRYVTDDGIASAVNDASLSIESGETLGLVGETGAGKTTLALGLLRLVPDPPGEIHQGSIYFNGQNTLELSEKDMRKIRGGQISMIFQDPMTALNPTKKVGDQIAEVIHLHQNTSAAEATRRACSMLEMVGIPAERAGEYPHQFSGGMKQRVVIAIALVCNPQLLIADEPTTALDVTIQAQVIEMMNNLKKELNTAVLMITHDLGIVAEMCDHVAIMYAGEIIEYGDLEAIYNNTAHPYTVGLLASIPRLDQDVERLEPIDGLMPDPMELSEGCYFCDRCPKRTPRCESEHPKTVDIGGGHLVKCHLYDQVGEMGGKF